MSKAIVRPGSIGDSSDLSITSLDFNNIQDKNWVNVEIHRSVPDQVKAVYTQQFDQALLNDPSKYYATVTRFSIPTSNIPVFIPQFIDRNSGTTIYSVTMSYNGNVYTQPVHFVSENVGNPSDEFYPFVYAYTDFLRALNDALDLCLANITPPMGALPPFFEFDADTSLISLVAQRQFYDTEQSVPPIQVFINQDLATLLEGFIGLYINKGFPTTDPRYFQFEIVDLGNNWYNPGSIAASSTSTTVAGVTTTVAVLPQYYKMTQNYNSTVVWSPLKSIRLKTSTIPIRQEFVITESIVLSGVGILQDFIPLADPSQPRPASIEYIASHYHLVNMSGSVPINKLDFTFVWVDVDGNENPIYLPANGVVSLQMAFFKKSTFTS